MIKLDDNYCIENDTLQFTLKYEENKGINTKTGKDIISTDQWYFPTMQQALKEYCNRQYRDCGSIGELIQKIDYLESHIDNIFNK